jgi:hypothetical protein
MPDVPFQQDFKVTMPYGNPPERATLAVSPTGDLQLVTGTEKLSIQLLRAVINDQALSREMINSKSFSSRALKTLVNLVLRRFKQNQLNDVRKSDSNFSGYTVYRRAAGTTDAYVKVSTDSVVWRYVDENLENGIEYDYGFTKTFRNTFESNFTDKLTAAPSEFSSRQEVVIGGNVIALPSDEQITFYVGYNKRYKSSELLDEIVSINSQQLDAEPRTYLIDIKVKDNRGTPVDLATQRSAIR